MARSWSFGKKIAICGGALIGTHFTYMIAYGIPRKVKVALENYDKKKTDDWDALWLPRHNMKLQLHKERYEEQSKQWEKDDQEFIRRLEVSKEWLRNNGYEHLAAILDEIEENSNIDTDHGPTPDSLQLDQCENSPTQSNTD